MAIGALTESHALRLHNAAGKQYRVFEFKLGIRPPFPESLQRLTEEFAILETR